MELDMFEQPSTPKADPPRYWGYEPPAEDKANTTFNSEGKVLSKLEVAYSVVEVEKIGEEVKTHKIISGDDAVGEKLKILATKLTAEHPGISVYQGIFGGAPHIKNVRLSVGDILAQLYVLESIDAVLEYYSHDVTKEQVKEAIAYAQDFLEMASESQAHG